MKKQNKFYCEIYVSRHNPQFFIKVHTKYLIEGEPSSKGLLRTPVIPNLVGYTLTKEEQERVLKAAAKGPFKDKILMRDLKKNGITEKDFVIRLYKRPRRSWLKQFDSEEVEVLDFDDED